MLTDEELAKNVREAYITLRGHVQVAVNAGLKVSFNWNIQHELEQPTLAAGRIKIVRTLQCP
jgi:hypothetical protein